MKKLLKIFAYIIATLLILLIILAVTASFSQKKIVDIALNKMNESIIVPIEIEDLSFTLIKRFPYATVELSGVKIGEADSILANSQNQSDENLLDIKSVFVSVKTRPLIKGKFEVLKIEIDDARLKYRVDSLGHSNISFLLDNYINVNQSVSDTTQNNKNKSPSLFLDDVELKYITITYDDEKEKVAANLFFPSMDIAGKITNGQYSGIVEGNLKLTELSFGDTNLNQMVETSVDFNLEYNADTLQIKSFEANSDGAHLGINGKAAFLNDMYSDLTFESSELDLKKLLKYAPARLLQEQELKSLSGILNLSGSIRGIVNDSVAPAIDAKFKLNKGALEIKDYPVLRKIDFEGRISNGTERNKNTTSLFFKSFYAETDSSSVNLSGSLSNLSKPRYSINSKLNIKLEEFKNYIPDTLLQNISGGIIADITTKGQLPDSVNDSFVHMIASNSSGNFDFKGVYIEKDSLSIDNLSGYVFYAPGILEIDSLCVTVPAWSLDLKNSSVSTEFTGNVTQTDSLEILLKSFFVETPQGNFRGSGKIENLEYPEFYLNTNAYINLDELKPFIPDTLIKDLSGNLAAEVSTRGKLHPDSIPEKINELIFENSELTLEMNNVSFIVSDSLPGIKNLNGKVELNNDTIFISEINGSAAGVDFLVDSTTVVNVYNTVFRNDPDTVFAHGNFKFGEIDYSSLAPFIPADTLDTENKSRDFWFNVKGKMSAKSFRKEKILLEDISAKFNVSDSLYIIDQLRVSTCDGFTNSSVRFSIEEDGKQIVNLKNHVERMDIYKFLYAFDNFGQDSLISYENISGLLTLDVNGRFVFDADTLVTSDMRAMGDFALENGRIVNYQPAMEIADFTGLKELDNIELKTVNSSIFLFKNKIYVPATNVVSTALDFSVFGMQSLGNNYEYHLQMKLGEVLTGKSKKLIERQNKNGDTVSEDDMDRSTIKIIYANIDGKEKTGFDNKKAQQQMELKIQVQKKMLNLIFYPKLVSFETGVQ